VADYIEIRGARQHNLKDISLRIKHNTLTVISGVSGSGKSSLAFDTIFAEGQRRFVESQSTYARQFLQRLDKPDADALEGLCPTIAVQSKNSYKSARSTVGTVTEVYDYLRLLFSKIGRLHCPSCGRPVKADTVDEMIEQALEEFEGAKAYIMAPMEISAKMTPELMRDTVRARGYSYMMAGGDLLDLETAEDEELAKAVAEANGGGTISIVVDRLKATAKKRSRIADSFETALKEGGGSFVLRSAEGKERLFSSRPRCEECGIDIKRPAPQELSFNSALGACPACKGFGDVYEIDMDAVVPDKSKTLREGALACWETSGIRRYARRMFQKDADDLGVRPDVPFGELTEEEVRRLMRGYGDLYGLEAFFERMKEKSYKISNRYFLMRYRTLNRCGECGGARLNPRALSVRLGGFNIAELGMMPVNELHEFFQCLELEPHERQMVRLPMRELISRTGYLAEIGLGYITMWRLSRTLSGGEMQRIHLAGFLGSRLTGTLYVLDEPTVGLHPRDTDRLIRVLKDLRDLGNTVIVVEHDLQVIGEADRIVELGPGPGDHGGEIVFEGTIKQFGKRRTLTADYLRGKRRVAEEMRGGGRPPAEVFFTVRGARQHNLRNIDVAFPAGRLTCVTGVSGSGKSSLVVEVLYPHMAHRLGTDNVKRGECDGIENFEIFDFVEMMGQEAIGKNPRANALTYMDMFSPVRQLFASTSGAKRRGLGPGAFSFNTEEGRCPKCEGTGAIQIDMQFLADVYVACDECDGKRFQPRILDIKYYGKSIGDVLEMTVEEALAFFKNSAPVSRKLQTLIEVGLGYLRIGQPLNTLSAGEGQRLKIAKELSSSAKGRGLFIFDEPTMGLPPDEVGRFLHCTNRLIGEGHTVVVIEHNLDVIARADHVIDLGPEGGDSGGGIVASGTPGEVAGNKHSITGRFLSEYLKGKNKKS